MTQMRLSFTTVMLICDNPYYCLFSDKFAMIWKAWSRFIENSISFDKPCQNITIYEDLFPSKTRCLYSEFIAWKPDKYGQTFWTVSDLECKCILNPFPYIAKKRPRSNSETY